MLAHLSRPGSDARTVARLRRAAAVRAAFATPKPRPLPGGQTGPAPLVPVPATIVRVVTAGGMTGWQITRAVGARPGRVAAVLLIDRARAARRATPVPTA